MRGSDSAGYARGMFAGSARRWSCSLTLCGLPLWLLACHAETPEAEDTLASAGAPPLAASPEAPGTSHEPEAAASAPTSPGVSAMSDANPPGDPAPDEPTPDEPATPVAAADAGPVVSAETALPPGVTSRFPRAGQSAVCVDAPLRLSFASPVSLGTSGRVRVFASDHLDEPADSIDLAAPTPADTLAGRSINRALPIFIEGTDAVIYLRRGALAPNRRYQVEVESGVFVDATGRSVADGDVASWTFETGTLPVLDDGPLRVDREAGEFCTIQGALDALGPDGGVVDIQPGSYHEMLYLTGKRNVTLRGADAETTRISYPNNERLNPGTASRAMVTALRADGLLVEGLTFHNTTAQGGSQAEALRVSGERVILRRSRFLSLQDTLLLDGLVYVADAYVEGNVDFVWGYGTAYFERSEIKVVGRPGVIVQARNDAAGRGYFFVDSRLTSDPGLGGTTLARIDASEYPNSEVAFVDCQLGAHITAQGWTVTGDEAGLGLRFLEFRSTDLSGQLLNVSQRHPASRQLDASEAAAVRDKPSVLGGWDPEG